MLKIQLIIIDGIPGSGKSTAGHNISRRLAQKSIAHRFYHELEDNHPLRIYDLKIESLHASEDIHWFEHKVISLFNAFAEDRSASGEITIVESWLFQDTLSFAFNLGMPHDRILALMGQIKKSWNRLAPSLVYFYQEDVEKSWRYICNVRGPEWTRKVMGDPPDYKKAAEHWAPNQDFIYGLVKTWDIPKLIIRNRDYQWDLYTQQIFSFLKLQ